MHDRDETRLHRIYGMEIPNEIRATVEDLSRIYQRIEPNSHLPDALIAYAIHQCQVSGAAPAIVKRGPGRPRLAEVT